MSCLDLVKRLFLFPLFFLLVSTGLHPSAMSAEPPANFKRKNLVAWCIPGFDAKEHNPQERATMLKRLGLSKVVLDWREMSVPDFEKTMPGYKEQAVDFFAFWSVEEEAFPLFVKHGIKPQIWRTLQTGKGLSNSEKTANAVTELIPIAQKTMAMGLSLGLHNHGAWGGLPDNMVAVCKALREKGYANVGLVYNFHHAHPRISTFADDLKEMMPYLICVNLNGMADPAKEDVSKANIKVKAIGSGEHEKEMIAALIEQGYKGPVGILGHMAIRDVEEVLRENVEGLEKILKELP